MTVTELEHYLVFPGAQNSGRDLLLLRHALLTWSAQSGIAVAEHLVMNEYRASLPRPADYTQFVLQWSGRRYFVVGRHLLTGEPLF
jgi:hypothetical protein